MSRPVRAEPPDQHERLRALNPGRSILVQAPAGSGKTELLACRFLRLLGEVKSPARSSPSPLPTPQPPRCAIGSSLS